MHILVAPLLTRLGLVDAHLAVTLDLVASYKLPSRPLYFNAVMHMELFSKVS